METHDQMDAGVAVPVLWGSDKGVFDSLGTLRTAMSDVAARCVDVRVTPRLFASLGPWLEANGAVNRGHTVRAGAPSDLAVPAETWALDGRAFAALFARDPDSDIVTPVPLPAHAQGVQVRIRPSGAPRKSRAVRVGKFFLPGVSDAPDEIGADELWRASEADPPSDAYDPMWFGPRLATGEPVYVASDEYRPGSALWGELKRFLGDDRCDTGATFVCTSESAMQLDEHDSAFACYLQSDSTHALVEYADKTQRRFVAEYDQGSDRAELVSRKNNCKKTTHSTDHRPSSVFDVRLVPAVGDTYRVRLGGTEWVGIGTAGKVLATRLVANDATDYVIITTELIAKPRRLAARVYRRAVQRCSGLPSSPINVGWPQTVRGLTAQQWLRSDDAQTTVIMLLFGGEDVDQGLGYVVRIVKEKCAGAIFVFGGKTDRDYGAIGTTVWRVPIDVLTFGPVPTGAFSIIASNHIGQFRCILRASCGRTATVGSGLPDIYSGPAIDAYKQATRGFPVLRYCPDAIPTRQSA